MQLANVVPLCPEGKPFGSSAPFSFLFTTLIYASYLGLNFSLSFLECRGQSFFMASFISDQGLNFREVGIR